MYIRRKFILKKPVKKLTKYWWISVFKAPLEENIKISLTVPKQKLLNHFDWIIYHVTRQTFSVVHIHKNVNRVEALISYLHKLGPLNNLYKSRFRAVRAVYIIIIVTRGEGSDYSYKLSGMLSSSRIIVSATNLRIDKLNLNLNSYMFYLVD